MGALRNKIAEDFDLIEESWKPVWITNWPLFEESIGEIFLRSSSPLLASRAQ